MDSARAQIGWLPAIRIANIAHEVGGRKIPTSEMKLEAVRLIQNTAPPKPGPGVAAHICSPRIYARAAETAGLRANRGEV